MNIIIIGQFCVKKGAEGEEQSMTELQKLLPLWPAEEEPAQTEEFSFWLMKTIRASHLLC